MTIRNRLHSMPKAPHCKLMCSAASEMLYFVYAGFAELAHRQLIELEPIRLRNYSGRIYSTPLLQVEVNGRAKVMYDTGDASVLPESLDLEGVDFYFKRSYNPELLVQSTYRHKIFPLGPIYVVLSRHDFMFRRALWAREPRDALAQVVRASRPLARLGGIMTSVFASEISRYEAQPSNSPDNTVLFMTQTWSTSTPNLRPDQRLWREEINDIRVRCIRALKREFGKYFVGGLMHNDFSRRTFADCLMPYAAMGRKDNYLRCVQQAGVCVTTAGGDVGTLMPTPAHKLGEYIAAGKAIVTEKTGHVFPGDFRSGANCLEFSTVDECVEAAVVLHTQPERRWAMMCRNYAYYHRHLRPDVAILGTLITVLSGAAP